MVQELWFLKCQTQLLLTLNSVAKFPVFLQFCLFPAVSSIETSNHIFFVYITHLYKSFSAYEYVYFLSQIGHWFLEVPDVMVGSFSNLFWSNVIKYVNIDWIFCIFAIKSYFACDMDVFYVFIFIIIFYGWGGRTTGVNQGAPKLWFNQGAILSGTNHTW